MRNGEDGNTLDRTNSEANRSSSTSTKALDGCLSQAGNGMMEQVSSHGRLENPSTSLNPSCFMRGPRQQPNFFKGFVETDIDTL